MYKQTTHQKKQIEIINSLEEQSARNSLKSSVVLPVDDFEKDPRFCLTSVHLPKPELIERINNDILVPLRDIQSDLYYYKNDSLHLTIKNIRVINDPPSFTKNDVEKARQIFSHIIPLHSSYKTYFYRLLLFPSNLALIGTTESELDRIIFDLNEQLTKHGIPDDKVYLNSSHYFCNITLARFNKSVSAAFIQKVNEVSETIKWDPYVVDSVTLLTCTAVLRDKNIIGTWNLA